MDKPKSLISLHPISQPKMAPDTWRSPFLNRAEPRRGHRYFDCRRKCSLSFGPYPCRLHNSKPLSRRDWLTKRQGGGVQQ
jgi:hypothetical protein